MELRLIIAYGLIAAMALGAVVFVAYRMYNTPARAYRRRTRQEQRAYDARRAPTEP